MIDRTEIPARLDAAFFECLFEGAGLPIFVCEAGGEVLAWNSLGEKLLPEGRDESRRFNLREILPEEQHAELEANIKTLVDTREPLEFRARIGQARSEAVEYAVWLTPIRDEHDNLECVCVWFHDITARLQLRRGMRKRERLASLGALAGSVAHHYNNLLCSIATSLEFSLNMNTMSAMRRVLRRTADAVGRATRLTQQLLAFAQADHRMCDLADLTEIVLQYFDQHEAEYVTRGVKLDIRWERIPFVPLPRDQFNIVIDNLTRNALEAMQDGGVLDVVLRRRDENNVTLIIADSGKGIAPEHMEHLFEPFFTTKGELGEGSTRQAGMGLAVAHGLVSEMHGTITVGNSSLSGARFEINLPIDTDR